MVTVFMSHAVFVDLENFAYLKRVSDRGCFSCKDQPVFMTPLLEILSERECHRHGAPHFLVHSC